MLSSRRPCLVVVLVFGTSSSVLAQDQSVVSISATLGGPSTFAVTSKKAPGKTQAVSSSALIQKTLLPALLSGADSLQIEPVPNTMVIKRVHPFELGNGATARGRGKYHVSRLATQRKPNGTDEHLEVFLKEISTGIETAHNVYDPLLGDLLIAAFNSQVPGSKKWPVDVQLDGNDIEKVTLGEK